MSSWPTGRETVNAMLQRGEIDRFVGDLTNVHELLPIAPKHLASAEMLIATDPVGAYSMLYDGVRKSLAGARPPRPQTAPAGRRGARVAVQPCAAAAARGSSIPWARATSARTSRAGASPDASALSPMRVSCAGRGSVDGSP